MLKLRKYCSSSSSSTVAVVTAAGGLCSRRCFLLLLLVSASYFLEVCCLLFWRCLPYACPYYHPIFHYGECFHNVADWLVSDHEAAYFEV